MSDEKKDFTREFDRYMVFKRSDIDQLSEEEKKRLLQIYLRVSGIRRDKGKSTLCCVVVESDWPEYEQTWQAIENRVLSGGQDENNI